MQFYLILLAILYLIVSFISIFKMEVVLLNFENYYGCVVIIRLSINDDEFSKENWWVFIVLLLLVGNVEVTGFKMLKKI